jgi:uncharacterized protein (DUF427 family)
VDGHRVALRDEPRRVEVVVDATVVASSSRTVVLDETGLPPRYYFPRDDVAMDQLAVTPTETVCPFKGQASYWSVTSPAGEHRDLAWCYEEPRPELERIAGYVCFYGERADHVIDGEPQPRPETPWSPRPARR